VAGLPAAPADDDLGGDHRSPPGQRSRWAVRASPASTPVISVVRRVPTRRVERTIRPPGTARYQVADPSALTRLRTSAGVRRSRVIVEGMGKSVAESEHMSIVRTQDLFIDPRSDIAHPPGHASRDRGAPRRAATLRPPPAPPHGASRADADGARRGARRLA